MPEKRYVKECSKSCTRCWENNLRHVNPQCKKWLAEHPGERCWLKEHVEQTKSKKTMRYYCIVDIKKNYCSDAIKREPRRVAGKNSRRARWADSQIQI